MFAFFLCLFDFIKQALALQSPDNMSVIVFPNAATVFAAVCACIFVVVGIAGKCYNCCLHSAADRNSCLSLCAEMKFHSHRQWLFRCIQTLSNYKLRHEQIIMRHLFIHIFLGNLITIIALLQHQKLRGHATTAFVLSLCISDLLFCSFSMPLTAVRYINKVNITFLLCHFWP